MNPFLGAVRRALPGACRALALAAVLSVATVAVKAQTPTAKNVSSSGKAAASKAAAKPMTSPRAATAP